MVLIWHVTHMMTWLEGCVTSLVPKSLLEEEILCFL